MGNRWLPVQAQAFSCHFVGFVVHKNLWLCERGGEMAQFLVQIRAIGQGL